MSESGKRVKPEFIVQSVDPLGGSVTECITAPNTQEAVAKVKAQGHRDIRVLVDDTLTGLDVPSEARYKWLGQFSPRKRVELATGSRFRPYVNALKQNWLIVAVLVSSPTILLIKHAQSHSVTDFRGRRLLIWLLIEVLAVAAIIWHVTRRSRLFRKIVEAGLRGDYERVLVLVSRFERAARGSNLNPATFVSISLGYRSRALARLGRREQGAAVLERMRTSGALSDLAFFYQRYMFDLACLDIPKALACLDELDAKFPNEPLSLLSRVECFGVYLRRPTEARALFNQAKHLVVQETAAHQNAYLDAAIAIGERRPGEARAILERENVWFARRSRSDWTVRAGLIVVRLFLACACGEMGDRDAARRYYRFSQAYLGRHPLWASWVAQAKRGSGM